MGEFLFTSSHSTLWKDALDLTIHRTTAVDACFKHLEGRETFSTYQDTFEACNSLVLQLTTGSSVRPCGNCKPDK